MNAEVAASEMGVAYGQLEVRRDLRPRETRIKVVCDSRCDNGTVKVSVDYLVMAGAVESGLFNLLDSPPLLAEIHQALRYTQGNRPRPGGEGQPKVRGLLRYVPGALRSK